MPEWGSLATIQIRAFRPHLTMGFGFVGEQQPHIKSRGALSTNNDMF